MPHSLTLEHAFGNGLTATGEEDSIRITGGFTCSVSTEDNQPSVAGVGGASLSPVETGADGTNTVTLTNFTTNITTNEITLDYTLEADGTRNTTELGLTMTCETATPFSGVEPDNPVQGEMVIADEGGGRITVTVVDGTWIDVALDADGDGTREYTTGMSWEDL